MIEEDFYMSNEFKYPKEPLHPAPKPLPPVPGQKPEAPPAYGLLMIQLFIMTRFQETIFFTAQMQSACALMI